MGISLSDCEPYGCPRRKFRVHQIRDHHQDTSWMSEHNFMAINLIIVLIKKVWNIPTAMPLAWPKIMQISFDLF